MFKQIEMLRELQPTVHCITNFVTVNDCANIILASGGQPIMAHHAGEVEEITARCQALVLNIGTLDHVESMLLAGKASNQAQNPVILDPVGVGGSILRRQTFQNFAENFQFSVIRGNASEIRCIATQAGEMCGVDVAVQDQITEENVHQVAIQAGELAKQMNTVIAVSGPIDIVTDGIDAYLIRNGHAQMARITGTGCMSSALIGAFTGAMPHDCISATVVAVSSMGVCGELARQKTVQQQGGTLTFRMHLIDQISLLTEQKLQEMARIEHITL